VFDNVTSYILFGTILAYLIWRSESHRESKHLLLPRVPHAAASGVAIAVIALAGGAVWFVNGPAYAQNTTLIKALSQQQSVSDNIQYFKDALTYNAAGQQEVREQLAQISAQVVRMNVPDDAKAQFAQLALSEMRKQEAQSPMDARFPLFEGIMLESFGQPDAAAEALQRAHELSPGKQMILYELGTNALARKDTAAALGYFKQAYELETDNVAARLYYAVAAIQTKQDALADELLAPVIPTGQAADSKIAGAYADRGQYQKIVTIWEARIAAQPSDVQAYFTLSAAYYAMHDTQHAIATLQKAEEVNPAAKKQADSLIEQLQSGTLKLK